MSDSLAPAYLHGFEVLSAAGRGVDALEAAWTLGRSPGIGPSPLGWGPEGKALPVGRVLEPLPSVHDWPLEQRSRNNQLALAAVQGLLPDLEARKARHGAGRIGVVVGTSTSGVLEAELAFQARRNAGGGGLPADFHYSQQEIGAPADREDRVGGVDDDATVGDRWLHDRKDPGRADQPRHCTPRTGR